MEAKDIEKIVCEWSMRTGTALHEVALDDLVDTLAEASKEWPYPNLSRYEIYQDGSGIGSVVLPKPEGQMFRTEFPKIIEYCEPHGHGGAPSFRVKHE